MTEKKSEADLDAEIVKAAFNVKEARRMKEPLAGPLDLLDRAFEAKDEALRPKLLTTAGAWNLFYAGKGGDPTMKAILDADRASVLKVIEALPRYADACPRTPLAPAVPYDPAGAYVAIEAIRRALGVPS